MYRIVSIIIALTLFSPVLASAAENEKPVKETVLAEIATKGGPVHLVEQGPVRRFELQNETLLEGTSFLDVFRFFRPKNAYDGLLVRDFTGPIHCPAQFRFIVLNADEPPRVTKPFGHCDAKPELDMKGKVITVMFKPFGSMPGEIWTFEGVLLKKVEEIPPEKKTGPEKDEPDGSSQN